MAIQRIFIAGPLFSESERWLDKRIVDVCESLGFKTFWSWRDAEPAKKYSVPHLYEINKSNIDKSDLIVANLDGSDADSGTSWEIGYAVAKGKPIIGIRTDFRVHQKNQTVNLMVMESVVTIVANLEELRRELQNFLNK